jgi:hypothetical protein
MNISGNGNDQTTTIFTMKKIFLILILLFSAIFAFAQNDSITISKVKTSSSIYLAYNSSVVYPGIRAGLEIPTSKIQINKIKKSGKQKLIFKDRFLTTNLGWYHHSTFHDNIYLTVGYTLRRTTSKGFFTAFTPELGYSRTFLGGTTYKVDEDGHVSIKKFAGYNYALVSLGGGLGYDFSISKSKPFAVYYKFNLLTMFPYNNTINLRPAMEIGLIYKPNSFLSSQTKSKVIYKNKHQK